MMRSGAVAMLVLLLGLSAACGGGSSRGAGATIPSNPTLDGVYARMERALDGGAGKVFHVSTEDTISVDSRALPLGLSASNTNRFDMWFDSSNDVARVEARVSDPATPAGGVLRRIVRKDGTFRVGVDGKSDDADSLTCRGSDSVVLAQLMRCMNYLEKSTTSVESGRYQGRTAIVLVTEGTLPSGSGSPPFEERLYIDPTTYLVRGAEESSTYGRGEPVSSQISRRYSTEFVDRSTLATDFFDPAAIGYVEKDPTKNLQPDADGMRVYWLGREFAAATGTAPLVMFSAGLPNVPVGPGYRALVYYELKGGSRNDAVIQLQEFPTDAWKRLGFDSGTGEADLPGAQPEEIRLPDGTAVLYRVQDPQERYAAFVYFDTTVVLIVDGGVTSAYSNRAAMRAVIRGLRPFQ